MFIKSLKISIIAIVSLANAHAFAQGNQVLWYKEPAKIWTDALPIGNGRLGAMVFAGVATDRIQFNEETLWTGKPRNYNNPGASNYLAEIRKLLNEGKQQEAEALAQEKFMGLKSEEGDRKKWTAEMASANKPAMPDFDDRSWKIIPVPSYEGWETVGLANLDGAVWFRTTFELPLEWKGKDLVLDLNRIRDEDFTYVNGKLVGNTDNLNSRRYNISAKDLKVGKNTLAIQVLNYFDKGGIAGYKDTRRNIGIYPVGGTIEQGISLVKDWKYHIQNNEPPATAQYQESYQPFGDLKLYFKDHRTQFKDYKRSLDLNTAISTTTYTLNGINYQREYFASAPNNAIVVKLSANQHSAISFDAELSSPHLSAKTQVIDNRTIALNVKVKHGALGGEARLIAVVKNGNTRTADNKISIRNADEVTLYLIAATNFVNADDVSGDAKNTLNKAVNSLKTKTYTAIKEDHVADYQRYYNAFTVDFGKSVNESLPTNERIEQFAKADDAAFAALYMQYGRYLLISSSRPGTQPANLQGIWNDLLSPPWGSKYTTNINLEMNYWPTEILNLSDLNEPLFAKIKQLATKGSVTAKNYYNANGWVLHHNTDLWNGTAPINASNHGIWVAGAAWLSHHLWEHYQFTKDQQFLAKDGYPLMKQAALFFDDFLIQDPKTGWLISTPSNSPENGGLVAGPTMDHQIIRSLYKSCIAASQILGTDEALRRTWQKKIEQLAPNQIGKHGQLQEWLTDVDDTTNKHRHVSHLWGVYPGNDITWNTQPKMMSAARQSLLYRGDEATGWSLAWKINFWARFKDGDHAMKMIKMLLKPAINGSSGSYVNLFDAHPPFQIDGNFGSAAGIAELIIQSHDSFIELLPALPSAIPLGQVKGIQARGGFEFNIKWEGGKLIGLELKSKVGGSCKLRYKDLTLNLETKAGEKYELNGDLKII
ncbi:glycoside hydrolase family 95 protein [Pedobacter insulae]|uniref:Alpha-L-fucosidase 2 n=1 Tax=Pedobacter insulae TaxID=414048 RepID=A0A1I2YEK0_9SPHI|nr:glycoside hydrolase N-terminal domain-containing protein [Pedobacter insulae]SFH24098.1 alpha-L-fucosidase 2 [Pedobacter insulae]